jgi:hypothetical protein
LEQLQRPEPAQSVVETTSVGFVAGPRGDFFLGSDLIDYWRNRLGKAERLILETLTQAYPVGLNSEVARTDRG